MKRTNIEVVVHQGQIRLYGIEYSNLTRKNEAMMAVNLSVAEAKKLVSTL